MTGENGFMLVHFSLCHSCTGCWPISVCASPAQAVVNQNGLACNLEVQMSVFYLYLSSMVCIIWYGLVLYSDLILWELSFCLYFYIDILICKDASVSRTWLDLIFSFAFDLWDACFVAIILSIFVSCYLAFCYRFSGVKINMGISLSQALKILKLGLWTNYDERNENV